MQIILDFKETKESLQAKGNRLLEVAGQFKRIIPLLRTELSKIDEVLSFCMNSKLLNKD